MTLGAYAELEFDLAGALRDRLIGMFANMPSTLLTRVGVDELVEDQQGVYQLFLDDELVYIGKTDAEAGLRRRLGRHALKIEHRVGLDPERVTFKAIRLFVFTVMDLETQLLKNRRPAWNGGGFGSNDPGRERDTTKIKAGNFDDRYPIDIHRPIDVNFSQSSTAHEALQVLRSAVPWKIRSQNNGGRSRQPHPELSSASFAAHLIPTTPWEAISAIVNYLPHGWQATALQSHAFLYKESRNYPNALDSINSP